MTTLLSRLDGESAAGPGRSVAQLEEATAAQGTAVKDAKAAAKESGSDEDAAAAKAAIELLLKLKQDAEAARHAEEQAQIPKTESGAVDYAQDFFGRRAYLTVSGQLNGAAAGTLGPGSGSACLSHCKSSAVRRRVCEAQQGAARVQDTRMRVHAGEMYASALGDIYTFGPTFRAENSNTSRHLAEFWMIEPELAFADLSDDIDCAEAYLKHCVAHILEHCAADLQFFDQRVEKGLLARLRSISERAFVRCSYTDAVAHLLSSDAKFEFPVEWGCDLQSEHERYLTEVIFEGVPVFVTDYPKDIKAFYMRMNADGKTVAAMDLLVPRVGELIGGSQREDRMDVLLERMAQVRRVCAFLDGRRVCVARHRRSSLRAVWVLTGAAMMTCKQMTYVAVACAKRHRSAGGLGGRGLWAVPRPTKVRLRAARRLRAGLRAARAVCDWHRKHPGRHPLPSVSRARRVLSPVDDGEGHCARVTRPQSTHKWRAKGVRAHITVACRFGQRLRRREL